MTVEEAEEPEAEAKVIDGRRMEVERTIAAIPAKTVAGILVKFQILVDPDPETYIGAALFVSGYHDLERLANGGVMPDLKKTDAPELPSVAEERADPIFAVIAEYNRIRSAWFALPGETMEEEERPAFQEGMANTSAAADVVCATVPTTYAGGQRKAEFYLQYIGGSIIPADVLEEIVAFFKLPRVAA